MVVVLITFVSTACDDSPTDANDDPEVSVSASFTIEPAEPESGEEVILDGSGSTVTGADQLSFDWELTTPDGSEATLDDPTAEVTAFEADVGGTYEVTLEVSAEDAVDSAIQEVDVREAEVEEISEAITQDRTLFSDTRYIVTSEIAVEATLTIEPGTTIEFEQGTRLQIPTPTGALLADGTQDEPILFTATSEQPGWWDGIYIEESDNLNNQLNWVTVEYGGGEEYSRSGLGNVVVGRGFRDDSSIDITNSTLRHSASHGLWVRSNGDLPEFEGNVITENSSAPVNIGSNHAHQLDAGSSLSGNDEDYVYVRDGHDIDDEDVTWENLDVNYRIRGGNNVEIVNNATLTIEPGTTLEFESGGQLRLDEHGGLAADGTQDEPILFTGTSEQPGWWDGIYLEESSHSSNKLNWVIVEYGGGEEFRDGSGNVVVGRGFRDDSSIDITNSTMRHSASYGLWVHSNSDLPEFEGNVITENSSAPVSIASSDAHLLDAGSSFSGNDEDYVYVRDGHDIDDGDVTWENLDVNYRIRGGNNVEIVNNATLTIEPGTTLEFESGGQLRLDEHGGLAADGTQDEPILFTGTSEQPGWWDGIYLEESSHSSNKLNWVIVEYGGGEEFRDGSGNVVVGRGFRDDSSIDITNSTLRHSDSYGLWVLSDSTVNDDACEVNTFESNGDDDCVIN